MELPEIMKRLPAYLAAGICVEIRGKSGIGKTDMLEQFADNMSKFSGFPWGIGSHFFATYTPPDVTGYLGLVDDNGEPVSTWSRPPWARANPGLAFKWLNEFKRGLLILEEFDKANAEVKKAAAPLILYGGVGGYFLHEGIGRIILSNHADEGRQGSTKEFDFVINRKLLLFATQTLAGWTDWAERNGIHPVFVAFAQEHVDTVFGGHLPEKQGPFCTPRSLVMAESAVRQGMIDLNGNMLDPDGVYATAEGLMGGPAAQDLITFLKFKDDVPDWADIVKSPGRAKLPDNAGAQLMVAHVCAYNVDISTIEQAVTYVRRLRNEFHLTFAKSASRRDFKLVNTKPWEKWTKDEPQLVALIAAIGGAR